MLEQAGAKAVEYDIQDLVKEFALLPSEAHDMLWNEIHQLERASRIREYVTLLALKHVKEQLRDNTNDLVYGLA